MKKTKMMTVPQVRKQLGISRSQFEYLFTVGLLKDDFPRLGYYRMVSKDRVAEIKRALKQVRSWTRRK